MVWREAFRPVVMQGARENKIDESSEGPDVKKGRYIFRLSVQQSKQNK